MNVLEHRLGILERSLAIDQRTFASLKFGVLTAPESLVASDNDPDHEAIATSFTFESRVDPETVSELFHEVEHLRLNSPRRSSQTVNCCSFC